jgi:4-carboxymuconolactone decarboxylase
MRILAAVIATQAVIALLAQAEERDTMSAHETTSARVAIQKVAPALDRYTQESLLGDVWKRPGLNMRDRSIVTLAALIARNQTVEMPFYLRVALDSGVKPKEISEIITHLAFYSGWENAMSAVVAAKDVFAARTIMADQLPATQPKLLPLDKRRKPTAPRVSVANSAPPSRASSGTQRSIYSVTCGCVPTSRRATVAL